MSPTRDQLAEIVSQLEIAEANSKFVEPDFWLRQFEIFQKANQYLGKTVENEIFEFYLNRLDNYTQEGLLTQQFFDVMRHFYVSWVPKLIKTCKVNYYLAKMKLIRIECLLAHKKATDSTCTMFKECFIILEDGDLACLMENWLKYLILKFENRSYESIDTNDRSDILDVVTKIGNLESSEKYPRNSSKRGKIHGDTLRLENAFRSIKKIKSSINP